MHEDLMVKLMGVGDSDLIEVLAQRARDTGSANPKVQIYDAARYRAVTYDARDAIAIIPDPMDGLVVVVDGTVHLVHDDSRGDWLDGLTRMQRLVLIARLRGWADTIELELVSGAPVSGDRAG